MQEDKQNEPKILPFKKFLLGNNQFIENLKKLYCVHKPETPSLLINEFLSQQQKISTENDKLETETQNTEETIKSAVSYYSRKIAFDPRMRLLIYEYVKQVSRISTNPTIKGTKEITTYDLLFPSKHINKLKLKKVKNDLVHLINEAERYDLINYEIDTIDKQSGSDLLIANLAELIGHSGETDNLSKCWDGLKMEILTKALKDYIYPRSTEIIKKE